MPHFNWWGLYNSLLCTHIWQRTVARMFATNLKPNLIGHPLERVCVKLRNNYRTITCLQQFFFLFSFLSCIVRFALAPKYQPELQNNACWGRMTLNRYIRELQQQWRWRQREWQKRNRFKGHSQLMHMHIIYHFLIDLHVIRRAWNRKWEVYLVYSKQTL